MVALVEVYVDNGPVHTPDLKYIAIGGSVEEIDSRLMEIIEGLHESEHIFSVVVGSTSTEMWVDTRCFL